MNFSQPMAQTLPSFMSYQKNSEQNCLPKQMCLPSSNSNSNQPNNSSSLQQLINNSLGRKNKSSQNRTINQVVAIPQQMTQAQTQNSQLTCQKICSLSFFRMSSSGRGTLGSSQARHSQSEKLSKWILPPSQLLSQTLTSEGKYSLVWMKLPWQLCHLTSWLKLGGSKISSELKGIELEINSLTWTNESEE